jgi:RNA polymerase sporulation-specific sigma factor
MELVKTNNDVIKEKNTELFYAYLNTENDVVKGTIENELLKINNKFIYHIVNKFKSSKVNEDDLYAVAQIGLLKAIRTFKIDEGFQFLTYAGKCIENEILMEINKFFKYEKIESLEKVLSINDEDNVCLMDTVSSNNLSLLEDLISKEYVENMYCFIDKFLTKTEKTIIKMHCGLENYERKTEVEIANELNMSRSLVSTYYGSAIKTLKNALLFSSLSKDDLKEMFKVLNYKEIKFLERKYGLNGKEINFNNELSFSPTEKMLTKKIETLFNLKNELNK